MWAQSCVKVNRYKFEDWDASPCGGSIFSIEVYLSDFFFNF